MAKYEDWVYDYVEGDLKDILMDESFEDSLLLKFLEKELPEGEFYQNHMDYYWVMNVKGMGQPDWDELEEVFAEHGLDVNNYSDYIYDDIDFNNNLTFDDINRNIMTYYPLEVLGRSGGHWGVNLNEIQVEPTVSEKIIDKVIDELELSEDTDDAYSFDSYSVAEKILEDYENEIDLGVDSDFINQFSEAWDFIKSSSDYMLSKDYAEELYDTMEMNGAFEE